MFTDAIHHYCSGNFTVSGPKATAGIFATYPAPYLSIQIGFLDQVRHFVISEKPVLFCHGEITNSSTKREKKLGHDHTVKQKVIVTLELGHTSISVYLIQVLGTAMLLLCLLALGDKKNQPAPSNGKPLIIGVLVLLIGVSFGSNSGYAINPTRDFGPRLFTAIAGWGLDVFR